MAFDSAAIRIGTFAGVLLCCGGWNLAAASDSHRETAADPTRDYLPAKYFERMAREDVRRENYAAAVNDYKQAAYWGNKVAQYDLGEIYLHGVGDIPADPARAVAWFGIAAETHQPDYNSALVSAYKTLTPEEHRRADQIWGKLQAVYGDKLTLARATQVFEHAYHSDRASSATTEDDPNTYTFTIRGYDPAGNIQNQAALLAELNQLGIRNGAAYQTGYWAKRKQEFAEFVIKQYGHVDIGPIQQVAPAKPTKASTAG